MRRSVRLGAVAVGGVGLAIAAAVGVMSPRSMLGGGLWALVVMAVLYGWGGLVGRALKTRFSIGEQLVAGTVAWIALTGMLVAIGVGSRVPLSALVVIGGALAVWDVAARSLRAETWKPAWSIGGGILFALLVVYLLLNLFGWVASRGNPYDDHTAYTAFVSRMLDVGNLLEPFSFRRVSAYGGQTVLLALTALRGDVESVDLLDRGIYQIITIVVLLDLMSQRKVPLAGKAVVVLFVVVLTEISINSAAIWSGCAVFAGAYMFATKPGIPRRTSIILAFSTCAAACTLRQNFLAPAGLFAILLLVQHLRERAREDKVGFVAAIRTERVAIFAGIAATLVVLVPYMIAAWRSNHTFLYPIVLGNANPAAPLRPTANTVLGELAFSFDVALTPEPIRIWWLLVPPMVIAVDPRPLKPFGCFALACALGFAFLVHSFALSDSAQLWRYSFSYMTPLAVVFLVEVVGQLPFLERDHPATLKLPALASLVVWLAVMVQFVETRGVLAKKFGSVQQSLSAGVSLGSRKETDALRATYAELQRVVPEGASLAALVDEPFLFDFARNDIYNLDIPGFNSPAPGLPQFSGPEAVRDYFVGLGIRYVAFVDNDAATYLYRRAGWFRRMFRDGEIWQFIAAHMIDLEDSFAALAKTRHVVFHRDGLYLVDLGAEPPAKATLPETRAHMDAFIADKSEHELGQKAWELASRADVVFVIEPNGPSDVKVDVPDRMPIEKRVAASWWDRVWEMGKVPPERAKRWLADRTHVRVHGEAGKPHHLHVDLDLDLDKLYTRPTVTYSIDGADIGTVQAGLDGRTTFDADVACDGWCDLYITVSTMSEWWAEAEALAAISLKSFTWTAK